MANFWDTVRVHHLKGLHSTKESNRQFVRTFKKNKRKCLYCSKGIGHLPAWHTYCCMKHWRLDQKKAA